MGLQCRGLGYTSRYKNVTEVDLAGWLWLGSGYGSGGKSWSANTSRFWMSHSVGLRGSAGWGFGLKGGLGDLSDPLFEIKICKQSRNSLRVELQGCMAEGDLWTRLWVWLGPCIYVPVLWAHQADGILKHIN